MGFFSNLFKKSTKNEARSDLLAQVPTTSSTSPFEQAISSDPAPATNNAQNAWTPNTNSAPAQDPFAPPAETNPFQSQRSQEIQSYGIDNSAWNTQAKQNTQASLPVSSKDVQLILSKLDLISSRLENLGKRLDSLEMEKRMEKRMW